MYRFDYYREACYIGNRPDACERHGDKPLSSPFRDALRLLCRGQEPPAFVREGTAGLSDLEMDELQGWAASNAALDWMFGIHVIETAERMVAEARADGALKED